MGVETSPLVETLASNFDGLNEDMGKAVLTVGTLITTMGALTSQTVSHAKEVVNVSQTMGMTTNQYQAWDYVLKSVGYDAESASGDLAALAEKAKMLQKAEMMQKRLFEFSECQSKIRAEISKAKMSFHGTYFPFADNGRCNYKERNSI